MATIPFGWFEMPAAPAIPEHVNDDRSWPEEWII
jgi:hypothetical protein